MRLYHFNPNSYGSSFFVIAESENEALFYLEKFCEREDKKYNTTLFTEYYNKFEKERFNIESFGEGKVIRTENS